MAHSASMQCRQRQLHNTEGSDLPRYQQILVSAARGDMASQQITLPVTIFTAKFPAIKDHIIGKRTDVNE